MKIRIDFSCFMLACLVLSCSKKIEPNAINFDVQVYNTSKIATTVFNRGDTINFMFLGNPDQIAFFSGEKGQRYKYINKFADTSNNNILSFTNNLTTVGNGNMQLMASNTFPNYTQYNAQDSINILASYPAGWTDISNQVKWSTGAGSVNSTIDLSSYAATNKPLTLAFRYTAPGNLPQSSWAISALGLRHITSDSTFIIDSINTIIPTSFPTWATSAGWGNISISNPLIQFSPNSHTGLFAGPLSLASSAATTIIRIAGNPIASTALATETWLVSGPLDLHQVYPDAGVPVKDPTTNATTSIYSNYSEWANYAYVFKNAGTYEVTFLASNNSRDIQNKQIITEVIKVK